MEAGFLEGKAGPVFHVLHLPDGPSIRGAVLFVPPLAEELNKSRRMVSLQARRLAQAGYAVLIPDLYGCGDSGGDFGDADWDLWLDDLARCSEHLETRCPAPFMVWGVRAGCLLAGDFLATRAQPVTAAIFWAPVTNGEQHLTQFLRLRMAAGLMSGQKEGTAQLRAQLDAGEPLEVAGYTLAPKLAARLAAARLQRPHAEAIEWFEVAAQDTAPLPPASERLIERWREEGAAVTATVVAGDAFWSTQDIIEVPQLLEATMQRLEAFP
ncbi:hydrolase 2, exosortase A system-associated [Thioalkalivibrio sp. ALM2T]|uniref:hydrolase 2, exosortase A system-associated n=1 Tax=Thioalkalivibrio sp. ALM2T TaxID=1158184 RepID=UPI00037540D8|nr:hydrolase 2, exosortase A system-associated [Thioalkalivibrio sp. ALM2T]